MAAASKRSNDPPKRPSQKSTMKSSYYLDQFQKLGYPKMVGLLLVSSILEAYLILHKKYHNPIFHIVIVSFVLVYFLKPYLFSGSSEVYLRDFSCYRPPSFCRVPFSSFLEHLAMLETFDRESVDFMAKVLKSSGQGQQTYLPPSLYFIPPRPYHEESIEEVQMVLFPVMEELLRKTDLSAQDVDILIVNCSGLCPSPSLASIIVHRQEKSYLQALFHVLKYISMIAK
ncbi:hypothetical protein Nepgr_020261 [Nepenthes gracilis]|uniref:FAE domain-containing protein n=1 Tax=Nepenthes gracilis TaxID=150966 RepID=A0AAD3XW07_NEPGR|nr:hypothetical protein Nepgr_020261 [Nepenthes gracilis]